MSYRRDGKTAHTESRAWSQWLHERESLVAAAGLPTDVVESEASFAYFVDYTYGRDGWLGKAPWFSVDKLDSKQRAALWSLIVQAYENLWDHPHESAAASLERTYGPTTWTCDVRR